MPSLVSVDSVTGPCDIIIVLEAESLSEVADLLTEHVHTISGVVRTVTCLVVGYRLPRFVVGRDPGLSGTLCRLSEEEHSCRSS